MLTETTLKLIFLQSEFVRAFVSDIDKAYEEYELVLESCTSKNEVKEVLMMDVDCFMPVPIMVDTFEKYLSLDRCDTEILYYYAEYINALIPDWKSYSKQLIMEAKRIDLDKNS